MATLSACWIPRQDGGSAAALIGPSGDSGNIFIGKNMIFRIWTDNTSGMSITFGLTTAPVPTSTSYSIGVNPQEFDTGNALDTLRLKNNSGISSANYFIQLLSKF